MKSSIVRQSASFILQTPHSWLVLSVAGGLLFQLGHFVEHVVQWAMWFVADQTKPWMSVVADTLSHWFGLLIKPTPEYCTDISALTHAQMKIGMEVLHLVGNTIFLLTVAGLYRLTHHSLVYTAFLIEAFHLVEHLTLTMSVIYIGEPLGFSTLFGHVNEWFTVEGAVGYRVSWHFIMNLIPTVLVMKAMMGIYRTQATQ